MWLQHYLSSSSLLCVCVCERERERHSQFPYSVNIFDILLSIYVVCLDVAAVNWY
jgi:hypothetical protein